MNPEFSILHATRGRPEKAVAAMQLWLERMAGPHYSVEYIFAIDADDAETRFKLNYPHTEHSVFCVLNEGKGSASAWDEAAKASHGNILIQAQDDVEPPEHWDDLIMLAIRKTGQQFMETQEPMVIAVSDGFRKDSLLCTAICNRMRYEQQGHFLYRGYFSVFSDDEFTIRAYADERDGRCKVINARDLTFLHRHCYHDKSVPEDDTYRRENSPEAYAIGQKVFMERNKHLVDLGFKTW
jgi:hypothetical protein